MKICMFVNNPIARDPRVLREAEYLATAGHEVTVIGRIEPGLANRETWNGIRFRRLFPAPDETLNLASRLWPLRKWYRRARKTFSWIAAGLGTRADVYHGHDLDTMLFAYMCAKPARKKIAYDSHELWGK